LLLSVRDFTWGHGDCQAMLFMGCTKKLLG
jgi:hypothetical protein